jgi:hypothetical protein
MKVFISYRRNDSAGHTGRLYDSFLAHFGADGVFMDLSGIDSGQNFVDVIHKAISSSDVLLAVMGKEWLTCTGEGGRRLDDPNDLVRAEIAAALQRGTPVIPVLVDGAEMPGAAALPDALKPLARRDAHELSDERWSYDVARLIEATEKLAGKPARRDRRTWVPIAAAATIAAILGVGFLAWTQLNERQPARAGSDSADATAGATTGAPDAPLPPAQLAGEWSAEVTYDWGDKYTERFKFKVDGQDVLGTASFLGSPRGIVEGTLKGDRVLFQIRTQTVIGDWNKPIDVVHRYRGTISGDTIAFYVQTEGGPSTLPVEFTATRVVTN